MKACYFADKTKKIKYGDGRKMKIYISGQISGYDGFLKRFRDIEKKLRSKCYDVYNPAELSEMPVHKSFAETWKHDTQKVSDYFLKLHLPELVKCDIILMLDGWEYSYGAKKEYTHAVLNKITIWHENEILEVIE